MSKKPCLNFLLSAFTQDAVSLNSLTAFVQVAQELKLKPSLEILELEKKAIALENHNLAEAFRTWMESIQAKLTTYKGLSDKIGKYISQFLEALYSQIISNIHKKSASELIKILATLSNKKYRLPDSERTKCKLRYYIYLSIIYLGKNKLTDCIECVSKVLENSKDPFDQSCCYNILALCECKCENHIKARAFHEQSYQIAKSLSNPVFSSIILYNLIIEALHLDQFAEARLLVKEAFEVAERNKQSRNLIFSKVLLLYQELCGKDLIKKDPKVPSANTLKKKTLEFVFKALDDGKTKKKKPNREASLNRGRHEKQAEIVCEEKGNDAKIISLGNKFHKKKRSKTEHGNRKALNKTKANQEIFVKFKREAAAKTIQRAWKEFQARKIKILQMKIENEVLKKALENIARVFQSVTQVMKKQLKLARTSLLKKVLKIQAIGKKMVYFKRFKTLKKSVSQIKSIYIGKRTRKQFLKLLKSVIKIQAFFRSVLQRKHLKIQDLNAKIIQKQAKKFIHKIYIKKNENFRKFVRKFLIKHLKCAAHEVKPLSMVKEESESSSFSTLLIPIIKIQSLFRMYPLREYYRVLKQSTCCIQRFFRGYLLRKQLKVQQKSARKIQKFMKEKFHFRVDYEISCF